MKQVDRAPTKGLWVPGAYRVMLFYGLVFSYIKENYYLVLFSKKTYINNSQFFDVYYGGGIK